MDARKLLVCSFTFCSNKIVWKKKNNNKSRKNTKERMAWAHFRGGVKQVAENKELKVWKEAKIRLTWWWINKRAVCELESKFCGSKMFTREGSLRYTFQLTPKRIWRWKVLSSIEYEIHKNKMLKTSEVGISPGKEWRGRGGGSQVRRNLPTVTNFSFQTHWIINFCTGQ